MSTLTLAQGGLRLAELPPTLQPNAIAAMAPHTDRRTTAGLSLLTYGLLAGAMLAVAAAHPKVAEVIYRTSGPIPLTNYERPVQATVQPVARPAAQAASSPKIDPGKTLVEAPKSAEPLDPAMPHGFSNENPSNEVVGTSSTTSSTLPPGLATPSGNTSDTGTVGTTVELTMAQVRVLSAVNPVYPSTARLIRAQGPVELRMTIDAQGVPTDVQVVSGHPVFHAEALRAARLWRFEPAQMGGRAVPASFRLTINFRLQ